MDGIWHLVVTGPSEGVHAITAVATDVAGNATSPSLPLTLTFDSSTVAPGTPVLDPASDTGASSSDGITSDTTPTFSGTADPLSTIALFSNRDGQIASGPVDGSDNWSVTASTALSQSGHTITAVGTDPAGNVSVASPELAVVIDNTLPVVSMPDLDAASDSGDSATDNLTRINTPTFVGTSDGVSITLSSDLDGVLGTTRVDGAGVWSLTATTMRDGAHQVSVTANDVAGNESAASTALGVTIDTAPPGAPGAPDLDTATDTGDSNTDNLTRASVVVITGTADLSALVTLSSDTSGVLGTTTAGPTGL